jgi:hypothetical protein
MDEKLLEILAYLRSQRAIHQQLNSSNYERWKRTYELGFSHGLEIAISEIEWTLEALGVEHTPQELAESSAPEVREGVRPVSDLPEADLHLDAQEDLPHGDGESGTGSPDDQRA